MSATRLHESGSVAVANGSNGVYPVTLITEGEGSTGIYRADVLQTYAEAFNGSPSFMNHPLDPEKPWQRDVTTIAGRLVSPVRYEEIDGKGRLRSDLKVDPRWVEFVEEYKDVIGLSIYIDGTGTKQANGKVLVESFDGADPYKSVDFVVAAGRGGRVERAMESLRAIESSLGKPSGSGAEASAQNKEKEIMDEKILEALLELNKNLAPVVTFVTELQAGKVAEAQTKVDAEAVAEATEKALVEYKEKDALIEKANLIPELAEPIRDAALKGEDVVPLIENATKIMKAFEGQKPVTRQETVRVGEQNTAKTNFKMAGVF